MTKPIETVRRTANISREDALKGLFAKFPKYNLASFEEVDNQFVAKLTLKSEFTDMGAEGGPPEKLPLSPEDEAGEEKPDALDSPEDLDAEFEKDEAQDEAGKLDEIIDLLGELLHGSDDDAPHDDLGPTGEGMPLDAGPSDLPAPVKPQNSIGMDGPKPAFAHVAGRRHFVLEAESPGQSLKSAVAELNQALAPTHRVAKIQRRGSKIIAGVTKLPGA